MNLKRLMQGGWLAAACLGLAQAPAAQAAYPDRPIHLIVPFAAGGTSDFTARVVAQKVSQTIGQSMVVENKGGAVGTIGADFVAKSTPDGYTIMLTDTTFAILPGIAGKLPYDPLKDFAPLTLGVKVPSLVCVNPGMPVKTLKELLEYARKNPGKVAYGSGGVGTAVHLAGAFLANMAGVEMIHVPYKGAGPAIQDVVAGQLQLVIPSMPTVVPLVKSGRLRALAITASKRSEQVPDVPTVAEAGLPNYDATSWFGFSAPAGTPRPIIDKLNHEMVAALNDPKVRETLTKQGADVSPMTPEQFSGFIVDEMKKWARVAKESHVTAEIK
ncbi:MAG TPA: tripartite tricarboxylate transporter substrate binding protein [Burkholderiales bacterium]|jgi:tripartite-type tricarboxylate transporter receptor subunit TctC